MKNLGKYYNRVYSITSSVVLHVKNTSLFNFRFFIWDFWVRRVQDSLILPIFKMAFWRLENLVFILENCCIIMSADMFHTIRIPRNTAELQKKVVGLKPWAKFQKTQCIEVILASWCGGIWVEGLCDQCAYILNILDERIRGDLGWWLQVICSPRNWFEASISDNSCLDKFLGRQLPRMCHSRSPRIQEKCTCNPQQACVGFESWRITCMCVFCGRSYNLSCMGFPRCHRTLVWVCRPYFCVRFQSHQWTLLNLCLSDFVSIGVYRPFLWYLQWW